MTRQRTKYKDHPFAVWQLLFFTAINLLWILTNLNRNDWLEVGESRPRCAREVYLSWNKRTCQWVISRWWRQTQEAFPSMHVLETGPWQPLKRLIKKVASGNINGTFVKLEILFPQRIPLFSLKWSVAVMVVLLPISTQDLWSGHQVLGHLHYQALIPSVGPNGQLEEESWLFQTSSS